MLLTNLQTRIEPSTEETTAAPKQDTAKVEYADTNKKSSGWLPRLFGESRTKVRADKQEQEKTSDKEASIPPAEVTNEKVTLQKPAVTTNQQTAVQPTEIINEKSAIELPAVFPTNKDATNIPNIKPKRSLWQRLVDEYRKNYCPRESPSLILPSCPTDSEKYSYTNMNRIPILLAGIISALSLSVGAWLFIHVKWYFFWYAIYAFYSEIYIFASFFITLFGKPFDLKGHNKKKKDHLLTEEAAPTVDIFLPVCKEPLEILGNTWKYIAELQYPASKLRRYVLDDGAQDSVRLLCERFGFTYIVRPDRPTLKKAGNMRHAFANSSGDFFVVFDADFCPRSDFLLELIPIHLADPKIAIVQTPQYFRAPGEQTWIEQGAGSVQEFFYRLIQTCRNTWGGSICVGSNAVYRRESLEAVGGTAPAECSEDVHTGFYAVNRGWRLFYTPLVLACGICPDTPRAFFSQQMRWCTGSLSLLTHRDFWRSKLTWRQKACYLSGMMYYSTSATAAFFNPLPAPILLWARPELMKYYNLFFAFPSLITGLIIIRWWARSRYTLSVQYSQVVMAYAYTQSFWDRFFGTKLAWVPSGDNKAHKNNRYRNMRILAWAWTITHNTVLITGAAYRICGGLHWYHVVPALVLDFYNFIVIHRFLFYRHARD